MTRTKLLKQWVRLARHERKPTPLSRLELARRLGIAEERVSFWESPSLPGQVPSREMLVDIARVTGCLLPAGWDGPVPGLARAKRERPKYEQQLAADLAGEIRAVGRALAHVRRHDARLAARDAQLFARRFGLAGEAAASYGALARQFGLTEASARQTLSKLLVVARAQKIGSKRFDTLARALKGTRGSSPRQLERSLRPLLGRALTLHSARRYGAKVLGRRLPG